MKDKIIKIKKNAIGLKTTLDSVIAPIPWLDTYSYGYGIDAITGSPKATAVEDFNLVKSTNKNSSEHSLFVQSQDEFDQLVNVAVSGKYNIQGVTLNASSEFLQEIQTSELSLTLFSEYQSTYDTYDEAQGSIYEFTDAASKLKHDPKKFREVYGDYFVAGGQRMSKFTCLYICNASSSKSMTDFKLSMGASAPEIFSAEGSAEFMQAVAKNNISVSFYVNMFGVSGTYPTPIQWTPEEIVKALNWFKENELGEVQNAKLKQYSTIDNQYPTTIDIDPEIFIELSVLYQNSWNIRTKYESVPAVYTQPTGKGTLSTMYQDFMTTLQADQEELAKDESKRKVMISDAEILLNELNAILDRMEFYFQVVDCIGDEPAENKEIIQKDGMRQWSYGKNSSENDAISISSSTQSFVKDYRIGHQETTLQFSVPNKIIVGWTINANRDDDYNGSWWKACSQIILKDYAAVHVKSVYDRGCNWGVTVYFVEANDYQF